MELYSQVLGGTSQALKANSIRFVTHRIHAHTDSRQNIVSSAYACQVHGPKHTWNPVFLGHKSLRAPSYTHIHALCQAELVTSSWGEFISDQSAAAQRLFCLPFAWNSLNSQITFQPWVFVYRSLNLQVFIAATCHHWGEVFYTQFICARRVSPPVIQVFV